MRGSPGAGRPEVLLALSSPLLILLALVAFLQRPGSDRLQAVPALAIGSGLVSLRVMRRRRRRLEVLEALRKQRQSGIGPSN